MDKNAKKIIIDGIAYVTEDYALGVLKEAEKKEGMPYVMIRTYSAGVHCGYLKYRDGKEVHLIDSIRIWKWSGAATLSQLAMEGTNDVNNCKFSMPITTKLILTEAIEVINMTEIAKRSIQNVRSWKI